MRAAHVIVSEASVSSDTLALRLSDHPRLRHPLTEMAWHLYQWGDTVEVIAPDELRAMVEGYRRDDFYPVLP